MTSDFCEQIFMIVDESKKHLKNKSSHCKDNINLFLKKYFMIFFGLKLKLLFYLLPEKKSKPEKLF